MQRLLIALAVALAVLASCSGAGADPPSPPASDGGSPTGDAGIFDCRQWQFVYGGIPGTRSLRDLKFIGGALYAVIETIHTDWAHHVVMYDTDLQGWVPAGSNPSNSGIGPATRLVDYQGLPAIGAGGASCPNGCLGRWTVAFWNPTTDGGWEPVDEKLPRGSIGALLAEGEFIIAGGSFNSVSRLTAGPEDPVPGTRRISLYNPNIEDPGDAWTSLYGGFPSPDTLQVLSLIRFRGDLYAGGYATGDDSRIRTPAGAGWIAPGGGILDGTVHSMTVFEGDLIVGGSFLSVGQVPAVRVARWDGFAWHAMGSGLGDPIAAAGVATRVANLVVYQDELYAVGGFRDTGAGLRVNQIARWNREDEEWEAVDENCPGTPQEGCGLDNAQVALVNAGRLLIGASRWAGGVESPSRSLVAYRACS